MVANNKCLVSAVVLMAGLVSVTYESFLLISNKLCKLIPII